MTLIVSTDPDGAVSIEVSGGGRGNTDEPEVHFLITDGGRKPTVAWFKVADLQAAMMRASHPIFHRSPHYLETERNPAE